MSDIGKIGGRKEIGPSEVNCFDLVFGGVWAVDGFWLE